ncbi:hypothetical protein KPH14_012054 [Odynerus spinipes]|uniref:BESS domain-containing protein n=1 Tax=Odynerus spinipes TaxID=1348599 RepID=A0AAD9R9J9_9HYME|nr:hypothetical protein KPH14_012054 [Odynerus spinipes]
MSAMYGEKYTNKGEREKQIEWLQKKWKNFRNSFSRELAKRKRCKSGSEKPLKTYMYFEQMSFLKPSLSHAESSNNSSSVEENEIESEEYDDTLEIPSFTTPHPYSFSQSTSRKRKVTDKGDFATSLKRKQKNEETIMNDPDRHFLLSLLCDFKKIPDALKAKVKIDIINAIEKRKN